MFYSGKQKILHCLLEQLQNTIEKMYQHYLIGVQKYSERGDNYSDIKKRGDNLLNELSIQMHHCKKIIF
jgi:hypothetical protein